MFKLLLDSSSPDHNNETYVNNTSRLNDGTLLKVVLPRETKKSYKKKNRTNDTLS
jgi:hypothetical protein